MCVASCCIVIVQIYSIATAYTQLLLRLSYSVVRQRRRRYCIVIVQLLVQYDLQYACSTIVVYGYHVRNYDYATLTFCPLPYIYIYIYRCESPNAENVNSLIEPNDGDPQLSTHWHWGNHSNATLWSQFSKSLWLKPQRIHWVHRYHSAIQ